MQTPRWRVLYVLVSHSIVQLGCLASGFESVKFCLYTIICFWVEIIFDGVQVADK